LETSGLDSSVHSVTEIAAVAFDLASDWQEVGSFYRRVKFRHDKASPKALFINSIGSHLTDDPHAFPESMDDFKGAPLYPRLMDAVAEWNNSAYGPIEVVTDFNLFLEEHATMPKVSRYGKPYSVAVLAGHNAAKFDAPFLRDWYKNLGDAVGERFWLPADFFVLDTLHMALENMVFDGVEYANLKLETLLHHHGIDIPQSHDALTDVRLTAAVAQIIRRRLTLDDTITPDDNLAIEKAKEMMALVDEIRTQV